MAVTAHAQLATITVARREQNMQSRLLDIVDTWVSQSSIIAISASSRMKSRNVSVNVQAVTACPQDGMRTRRERLVQLSVLSVFQ